jgi:MFS family permease
MMWVVLGLVSALGSAVLGRVADKVGKRTYVLWATGLVAVGLGALANVDTLWLVTALGVPVGVLSASRGAALLALVSDLVPAQSRGTLMGLRSAAVNLGTGTVPALAGAVIEARGFPSFLWVAAGCVAAAWLLVWRGVAERAA